MKIDRLLAITVLLINKRRVQARDLAGMFDVSVRTIYRDIEAINQAGIPVVTYQGTGGGIGIADGYRLEKGVLTNDDLATIARALKSVSSSYRDRSTGLVLEKIKALFPRSEMESFMTEADHLFIDFTPWGSDSRLKEKVETLKEAINSSRMASFTYYSARGETTGREVDPHTLVLKGQKWYLYAFCRLRNGFRLFKLSRMKNVEILVNVFKRREINLADLPWEKEWAGARNTVPLALRFDGRIRTLVEDWFGVENVSADNQGNCLVEISLPEDEWLYGFILSFGSLVEVLGPEHIREKIKEISREIHHIYEEKI